MQDSKMNDLLLLTDVLDVLSEVDEKSKRNPEIIQYFVVSLLKEVHC